MKNIKSKKVKPTKDSFIDLGDEPMELPKSKSYKYYPSIRMRKSGMKKGVGQTGTAIIKFKVRGIELRDGETPETNLELTAIKEQK